MKIIAWLCTWAGIALIGLFGWVVPWVSDGEREGAITRAADTMKFAVYRAEIGAAPALYASHAWIVIGGVIAAFGLFMMFSGRRDRWIAVVGYVLGGAYLGVGAFGTFGVGAELAPEESLLFAGALGAAAVMLIMAALSLHRSAFLGAIPAGFAALVGLGWSIWFLVSASDSSRMELSALGWALPGAHVLILIGALLSIAAAGRDKQSTPQTPAGVGA